MALFTTLYSGSSGNCALILHEGKYLLIDMGKSCRTTLNALRSLGLAVSDCEGFSLRTNTQTMSAGWILFSSIIRCQSMAEC